MKQLVFLIALTCGFFSAVTSFARSWMEVPGAVPPTTASSLYGVAVVSGTDVWAVGSVSGGEGKPLIEHWDGTSWAVVPNQGTSLGGYLSWSCGAIVRQCLGGWAHGGAPDFDRALEW